MVLDNCRQEWYDAEKRVMVTMVDVKNAAQSLSGGHLCGPASAYVLSKALAAAALLGAECSTDDETLIIQMKCSGPIGGFNVECTAGGTLRGYTEKKILDDFDASGVFDDKKILGDRQIQIVRSVPGKILSQGISNSLDGYLAGSLQRKACVFLEASVSDEVKVLEARGIMVEAMPDSDWSVSLGTEGVRKSIEKYTSGTLSSSPRNILEKMGLQQAELKKSLPLSFACRCSPERAAALISSMGADERKDLPAKIDITCHMCGRVFTVSTGN